MADIAEMGLLKKVFKRSQTAELIPLTSVISLTV